jgi:hypothetical protein
MRACVVLQLEDERLRAAGSRQSPELLEVLGGDDRTVVVLAQQLAYPVAQQLRSCVKDDVGHRRHLGIPSRRLCPSFIFSPFLRIL